MTEELLKHEITVLQAQLACKRAELSAIKIQKPKTEPEPEPELTHEQKESILKEFIDLCHLGKDYYCREKVFVESFDEYCKNKQIKTPKWSSQLYYGPFTDANIKLVKNQRRRYPNEAGEKTHSGTFIFGIDIKA